MDISPAALTAQYQNAKAQWPFITTVNGAYGLPPALLYAIGSRETNLTNELGDGGHGHGVFQLDDRSHTIPLGFDDDVQQQATTAAQMMQGLYQQYGDWTEACNAYNSGGPDTAGTTGQDYGLDVVGRQAYLAPLEGSPGSITNQVAAAADVKGVLQVFMVGGDGVLYHAWQDQNGPYGGWTDWASLGGQQLAGGVAAATNADGRLEAFVTGGDGVLYHNWQNTPGGTWSGWAALGGSQLHAGVAAARNADGRVEIFAVGGDGVLYHNWQTAPNNGWSGWASLGGQQLAGGVAAATNADGRLEIFAVGGDGVLYHNWQNTPGGTWSGWAALSSTVRTTPAH
jgi:hypothetical protein